MTFTERLNALREAREKAGEESLLNLIEDNKLKVLILDKPLTLKYFTLVTSEILWLIEAAKKMRAALVGMACEGVEEDELDALPEPERETIYIARQTLAEVNDGL